MKIIDIQTVFPEDSYTNDDLLQALKGCIPDTLLLDESFFQGLGIEKRSMAIDPFNPQSWWDTKAGTHPFAFEGAKAYCKLMADKEPLTENDKIIVISNTPDMLGPHMGYALECHIKTMDPKHSPPRMTTLIGEGCSGYISGLREADDFLKAYPERRVVVITVEMSTPLTWNPKLYDQVRKTGSPGMRKGLIIQRLLFGDGCTASLLSAEGDQGLTICKFGRWSNLSPHDIHLLEGIGHGSQGGQSYPPQGFFKQKPQELFLRLSQAYLPLAHEQMKSLARRPSAFAVHTGSGKILDAVKWCLGLKEEDLHHSRQVLSTHANMNSSTGAVILQKHLREGVAENIFSLFFGVGFCLQTAFSE